MKKTNELIKVIESSGIEIQTGNHIKETFMPFFEQAEVWEQKAKTLIVNDISQVHEMKIAREARLALREIRVNANKARIRLKEESLRYGKAVQGVYNVIDYLIVPIEKHLAEQEKFIEIQEANRKAELKLRREIELQPFEEFVPFAIDLANMSDEDYGKLFNGAKLQFNAKIEDEKKIEAERIAKEKAEAKERERIRIENKRLKKEAEEKEKQRQKEIAKAEAERKAMEEKARKEREANEAKLKAEREAKAKLEAELKAKAEAERKAKIEEQERIEAEIKAKKEAERKAKAAPDKAKLIELAKSIDYISFPEVKSEEAQRILISTRELLNKVSNFIREKTSNI